MQIKFKQLLLLLLIWAQVSWLNAAPSKDSSAAPSLLLANELGPNVDPARYLISEKYDGVRAIWDGKMLRFRSGRTVNAPAWFVAKLPAQALDRIRQQPVLVPLPLEWRSPRQFSGELRTTLATGWPCWN